MENKGYKRKNMMKIILILTSCCSGESPRGWLWSGTSMLLFPAGSGQSIPFIFSLPPSLCLFLLFSQKKLSQLELTCAFSYKLPGGCGVWAGSSATLAQLCWSWWPWWGLWGWVLPAPWSPSSPGPRKPANPALALALKFWLPKSVNICHQDFLIYHPDIIPN